MTLQSALRRRAPKTRSNGIGNRSVISFYLPQHQQHWLELIDGIIAKEGLGSRSDFFRLLMEDALIEAKLLDVKTLEPIVEVVDGNLIPLKGEEDMPVRYGTTEEGQIVDPPDVDMQEEEEEELLRKPNKESDVETLQHYV